MTVSTENTRSPKSTSSRNSNFMVSRGTKSHWEFGSIWICTEEFEFLDFGGVAFSVETGIDVLTIVFFMICVFIDYLAMYVVYSIQWRVCRYKVVRGVCRYTLFNDRIFQEVCLHRSSKHVRRLEYVRMCVSILSHVFFCELFNDKLFKGVYLCGSFQNVSRLWLLTGVYVGRSCWQKSERQYW